jgi:hypothetical protein
MRDGFILLLTVFLSSLVAAAQTPTPQTVPTQERVAPIITRLRPVPVLSAPRFLVPLEEAKSAGHFSYLFVRTYERDQSLENLSRIQRVRTLFLTTSNLTLFQIWGGRLRLDGFTGRLHMQNPGGPRSVKFYGLSLRVALGRDTQIGRPTQTWRRFGRFVSGPR